MAGLNPFEPFLRTWARVSDRAMQRWSNAMDEVDRRTYSYEKAFSDAIGAWGDLALGWGDAVCGPDSAPLIFDVTTTTEASHVEPRTVRGRGVPRTGAPRVFWKGRIPGSPGPGKDVLYQPLTADNVEASREQGASAIRVTLKGLYDPQQKPPRPLEVGDFQAVVHVGEAFVAEVLISVR